MKCDLSHLEHCYEFSIEPENEIEKCALEYLASRPSAQVTVQNTRLGLFLRQPEDALDIARAQVMKEVQTRKQKEGENG